ncbi:hypothetical protein COCON_G00201890 [Conger conger]|uniref:Uncharacterized protein n=1 Tax=Conger conger TaxID=82655 RepID=A0A9Q1CZG7_CONCO|nr:hypothetical protein COCON_G00201890 [Conger conger]
MFDSVCVAIPYSFSSGRELLLQVMSARPASPAPSISLLEIRSETRLVLGAFLRRSAAVPPGQRPGRVGGTYWDHNKFR